ncbi:MAG: hypothetical protein ACRDPY_48460 [Streptosporangiaceae bacterium]
MSPPQPVHRLVPKGSVHPHPGQGTRSSSTLRYRCKEARGMLVLALISP